MVFEGDLAIKLQAKDVEAVTSSDRNIRQDQVTKGMYHSPGSTNDTVRTVIHPIGDLVLSDVSIRASHRLDILGVKLSRHPWRHSHHSPGLIFPGIQYHAPVIAPLLNSSQVLANPSYFGVSYITQTKHLTQNFT